MEVIRRGLYTFLFFWIMSTNNRIGCFGVGDRNVGFVVEYFNLRRVRMVTVTRCRHYEPGIDFQKKFSEKMIAVNWLDIKSLKEGEMVEMLKSEFVKLGVLVDLKCPQSLKLLEMADKNLLFKSTYSRTLWLVLTPSHVSNDLLRSLTKAYVPQVKDHLKYLTRPYSNNHSIYLLNVNRKVNAKFFATYKKPEFKVSKADLSKTDLDDLLKMDLLLDSDVVLAIPGPEEEKMEYNLIRLYKATTESQPEVEIMGNVTEEGRKVWLSETNKKPDMKKGILRAASVIFQPDTFTRIDDLATRESDIWAKMTYAQVKLLAEDLNFIVIIRFYNDYGWLSNGTFTHVIGALQRKEADFSAASILMRKERFMVAEFMDCPFRFQTGILFREPSLSSVSNIFILPFSKDVWISIGIAIILTMVTLRFRAMAGGKLVPPDDRISTFLDANDFIVGAVCQQGFAKEPKSVSARVSIFILLLTSLALFTSYSASILALLQSSSSAITSVVDITNSKMEVGIQANFTLYKIIMKEEVHPVLKEFYRKKVLSKGDKAFYDQREGIEKMRTGMFAFEVELTAGYKRISETYEEIEKCGIKDIQIMEKPLICMAARKHSSYREIFTQRLVWQREAGLFDRSWKLWVDQKPKCEMSRIGFISVGLTEFRPPLLAFAYGVAASFLIFLLEILYKNRKIFFFIKTKKYFLL